MQDFDEKIMENANAKLFSNINIKINNIIFVYTPVKVGSTTLVTSIRISAAEKFIVIHIHNEDCLSVLTGIKNITINDLILYNSYIGKNVYVIDIYRSPIERKISTFFEYIYMHFNNSLDEINKYSLDKLITRFNNLFPHIANDDYYLEKYDIEIPDKFDFNNKFLITIKNKVKYIKLRLKDSHEWGIILSNLLETEIVLVNDHETNNKVIKDIYTKFKEEYKLPQNFYELIKNDKYLNYYYSVDEISIYMNEWLKKTNDLNIWNSYNEKEYELYLKITVENQSKNLIQYNHYIDLGCLCKLCSNKRNTIKEKAKKGEKINDTINHNELVNVKFEKNKIQKMMQDRIFFLNNFKKISKK
jgi:hypothetical protein